MTREEEIHWLEIELKLWEDECKSKHPIKEALSVAIKTLEQEPILDKIRAELIQSIQNGTLKIESGNEELFRIIDKYRGESEE